MMFIRFEIARNAFNSMSLGLELSVFAENLVIILVSYCIIGHLHVADNFKLRTGGRFASCGLFSLCDHIR